MAVEVRSPILGGPMRRVGQVLDYKRFHLKLRCARRVNGAAVNREKGAKGAGGGGSKWFILRQEKTVRRTSSTTVESSTKLRYSGSD